MSAKDQEAVGVKLQYEAYPYPERDPAEEKKRLIVGSPSNPLEIDHYLFAGQRDWSKPLNVLVAGGGTGDGLVQLAQLMSNAGRAYKITYLDLSTASREIAEARVAARGLENVEFHTGSLLDAAEYGRFDYIDCCGVLHHLPEPQEGFDALANALSDEGGMGLMVYAPYGRSGVYPLQAAFGSILRGAPKARLAAARKILDRLPPGHPFKRNPNLNDHNTGDAGFYDLLLHSQDRAYTIRELDTAIRSAGLELVGMPLGYQYDPLPFLQDPALLVGVDDLTRMELAEQLSGTIRTHVAYVAKAAKGRLARPVPDAVPNLKGISGARMAQMARKNKGVLSLTIGPGKVQIRIGAKIADAVAQIDGQKTLAEITKATQNESQTFTKQWHSVSEMLTKFGLLYYSRLNVK